MVVLKLLIRNSLSTTLRVHKELIKVMKHWKYETLEVWSGCMYIQIYKTSRRESWNCDVPFLIWNLKTCLKLMHTAIYHQLHSVITRQLSFKKKCIEFFHCESKTNRWKLYLMTWGKCSHTTAPQCVKMVLNEILENWRQYYILISHQCLAVLTLLSLTRTTFSSLKDLGICKQI